MLLARACAQHCCSTESCFTPMACMQPLEGSGVTFTYCRAGLLRAHLLILD